MNNFNRFLIIIVALIAASQTVELESWAQGSGGTGESFSGTSAGLTAIGELGGRDFGATLGFWVWGEGPELCVSVTPDTWNITDSLNILESREMLAGEVISVGNCSNCRVLYGMRVVSVSPVPWIPHSFQGDNLFVLLGQFSESPPTYSIPSDLLSDELRWCDEYYGDIGSVYIRETTNLWFRISMPLRSDIWGENNITIELSTRIFMP